MEAEFSRFQAGCTTRVFHEDFSVCFEFPHFEVTEKYEETVARNQQEVILVRRISLVKAISDAQFLGQTINLLSSWCAVVSKNEEYMRVGLALCGIFPIADPSKMGTPRTAFCKLKMSIVDKDGDLLFTKPWRSWENAVKFREGLTHSMPDFIHLDELLANQGFYSPNKLLRLRVEGTLYSEIQQIPLTVGNGAPTKTATAAAISLWENNMPQSDLDLFVKDEKILSAHKDILIDVEGVLGNIVETVASQPGVRAKLQLDDISEADALKMLCFIYTGSVNMDWSSPEEVQSLAETARTYELLDLQRYCANKVGKFLTSANFLDMAKALEKCLLDSPSYQSQFNKFFRKNSSRLKINYPFQQYAKENRDVFRAIVLYEGVD